MTRSAFERGVGRVELVLLLFGLVVGFVTLEGVLRIEAHRELAKGGYRPVRGNENPNELANRIAAQATVAALDEGVLPPLHKASPHP